VFTLAINIELFSHWVGDHRMKFSLHAHLSFSILELKFYFRKCFSIFFFSSMKTAECIFRYFFFQIWTKNISENIFRSFCSKTKIEFCRWKWNMRWEEKFPLSIWFLMIVFWFKFHNNTNQPHGSLTLFFWR
jgi:hypothetical protein